MEEKKFYLDVFIKENRQSTNKIRFDFDLYGYKIKRGFLSERIKHVTTHQEVGHR